ncbi:NAD-dependent epimerase/dehydratase family protein [Paenibacillus sp. MMS18-CY102]|uniref:NAD-dependent epimerase/dehydratase family protein n=1 Tax=Paenibacillus sp. MMS18-CY102 TaxID=2682849 RepID=UPI00136674D7|nr:NAD(P)-dependent oxidoreductase [Paenibacillus sp. MMS18-CY102]MWC29200.1 NAD-dependent epimerase/dehydratase family protein [Paenibacillus sp. MMS18-CY102]
MNIFVTGVTGKVGSRLVPRLLQRGHHVKVLVRDAVKAGLYPLQGAEIIEGHFMQAGKMEEALRGMDAVIHLAAEFRGVDEATARSSNIDAAIALANAAIKANVPRFVFASTNLVYGSVGLLRPNREDDRLQPAFLYPQTKATAEAELLQLHEKQGLGLRIVRLAFVYGERDPHLSEFLPTMSSWNPAKRLHMAHHADVSQALLLAASTPGIDGRIYNVADDAPISVAELLQHHAHSGQSVAELPLGEFNPFDMIVDTARIRNELNYRPIFPSFYTAKDAGAL